MVGGGAFQVSSMVESLSHRVMSSSHVIESRVIELWRRVIE
jgi:hypothetical protein